jgi:hypothetical protein
MALTNTDAMNGLARMHSSTEDSCHQLERRRRSRASVQWTVYVSAAGFLHPVRGTTVNISPCGFYGIFREKFTEGEQLKVRLVMVCPPKDTQQDITPCLDCWATLMRVEAIDHGAYGTAFSIEDYTVNRLEKLWQSS